MKYRSEIDGLRAVAVLFVLFYHADFINHSSIQLSGGFIGVDVFFVISGYLITFLILHDIQAGNFLFKNFYERRARRILPALFFVMLTTMPFAWFHLLPQPFKEYAASVVTSTFFSSNILFLSENSYTAQASALKPLLHTWSLSVEEQFYIVFPVVLLALCRFARKSMPFVLVAGFVSLFILADRKSLQHPDAAFYLFYPRGWEFLAGALLARWEIDGWRSSHSLLKKTMPSFGIVLLLLSLIIFNDKTRHPSYLTLLPVCGTMLIIWFGGGDDIASRVLSSRLLVGIGLMSYSLYLWHVPVLVLARLRSVNPLSSLDKWLCLIFSAILALLTWKYIEKPFRDRQKISLETLRTTLALAAVILVAFSAAVFTQNGFPGRLPTLALQEIEKGTYPWNLLRQDGKICYDRYVSETCVFGEESAEERWIMVGDSHLAAFSYVMWETLENRNAGLITLLNGACPYALGMEAVLDGVRHPFTTIINEQRRDLLKNADPSIVVIGSRLPLYLSGSWFDNGEGGIEDKKSSLILRSKGGNRSEVERKAAVRQSIISSTEEILSFGHKVVLIYPIPAVGWSVPETYIKLLPTKVGDINKWFAQGGITTSFEAFQKRTAEAYGIYDSIKDHPNLLRIYPEKLFCNTSFPGRCITHDHDNLFYTDDDHLSLAGGQLLVDEIMKEVNRKWGEQQNGHTAMVQSNHEKGNTN